VNEILKQRLVGALILVALGVIFWPIIFVQPGHDDMALQGTIPPRPGISTTALTAPDPIGLRASPEIAARSIPVPDVLMDDGLGDVLAKAPRESTVAKPTTVKPAGVSSPKPAPGQPRESAPEPLALDGDGIPLAWILQVASVSVAQKADSLRMRLLDMGHKGYVKKVRSGERDLYRVYIGPKFERDRLERLQPEVDSEFGVTSMIVRYVP
jgi:DedD protein